MRTYETPNIELIVTLNEDIITTSLGLDTSLFVFEESSWIFGDV